MKPTTRMPRPRRLGRALNTAPIALAGLLALFFLADIKRAQRPTVPPATDERALLDSLSASEARHNWVASLVWAEQLGRLRPRDSKVLQARGTAWSNFGIGQRPAHSLPRPAVRTSLERTACQVRALELTDSAAITARNSEEWTAAVKRLGELQEVQGLPGDALLAFELIRRRVRDDSNALIRTYWLRAMLRDPVRPDTSEWDLRMRLAGFR